MIDTPPALPADERVTDAEIEKAIRGGVDFLLSQFEDDAISIRFAGSEARRAGLDALCVYALLEAGRAVKDDRLDQKDRHMQFAIEKLKSYRIEPNANGPFEPVTYGKSLRALALSVHNRPEDRKALKYDVDWLVNEEEDGAFSYGGIWSTPHGDQIFGDPNHGYRYKGQISQLHVCHPRRSDLMRRMQQESNANVYLKPPLTNQPTGEYPKTWFAGAPAPAADDSSASVPIKAAPVPNAPDPRAAAPAAGDNGPLMVPQFPWDNSNSQYGMLAAWCGAELGIEVPTQFWKDVEGHWLRCELKTGEWGYKANDTDGSLAMTCAGITALLISHENIQAPQLHGGVGRDAFPRPLAAGLAWLEAGDNSINIPGPKSHYIGYDLYSLETVGQASGFKYFGAHDWYRELAKRAVNGQWPNGAWGRSQTGQEAVIDTAYTLLFLARGRHPVFMNKLRFDGSWCNRPHDISSLAKYATRVTERPMNWQVVTFGHGWQNWLDSPVLYLASHKPPELKVDEFQKLRVFVEAGGLLFTHADGDSAEFTKWVTEVLAPKIAPGYELKALPDGHPIFHLNYDIAPGAVKLMGVENGSRLLLVHSQTDLGKSWQGHFERVRPDDFRLGVNLFLYAAGKTDLRNKFSSPVLPDPPAADHPAMPVALLRYVGNWSPEPFAWNRFARACRWDTGLAIAPTAVDLAALKFDSTPVAHLTGTSAQSFTDAESAAVRQFVESGGILIIDPCGGSGDFAESVRTTLLAKAFPGQALKDLPADHPLFKGLGKTADDVGTPRLRPYANERLRAAPPRMQGLESGKGFVIFSPLDLTTGLLNSQTWPVMGYAPASCDKMLENAMRWTVLRSTQLSN